MALKTAGAGSGYFVIPTQPAVPVATTQGAANVYGAYVQMIASTSAALYITHIVVLQITTTNSYAAVQVATGGSGSESVVAEVVTAGNGTPTTQVYPLPFPVPVATTTRIAARSAGDTSGNVRVLLICINQANVVDAGIKEQADVQTWLTQAIPTPNVTGEPLVDINHVNGDSVIQDSGTSQAVSSTTLTLRAGASATTDKYKDRFVLLDSGTGASSWGFITAYNGTTKVATINGWTGPAPSGTPTYVIIGF